MTDILLHASAHARIKDRLSTLDPALNVITMQTDGALHRNGVPIEMDDINAHIFWASIDFLVGGPVREAMIALLKSETAQWVQTASAGLDAPVWQMILDKGIRLTNSDAQAIAIAEYVMANVMAEFQPTFERREAQTAHEWKRLPFRELSNTNWLIVGFGHIGSEVGRRAKAFGAHVTGVRHSGKSHELADHVITQSEIHNNLSNQDVVVLACPLTEATKIMVDGTFLSAMNNKAVLVNIGRGQLINEDALIIALDTGTPEAAILDVFQTEPLPEGHPLWDHPKVRVTAHTSAFGSGTRERGDDLFLENLQNFLNEKDLRNEVTKIQ